jgi:hypothetical protein
MVKVNVFVKGLIGDKVVGINFKNTVVELGNIIGFHAIARMYVFVPQRMYSGSVIAEIAVGGFYNASGLAVIVRFP